jgi:hypothetical protein
LRTSTPTSSRTLGKALGVGTTTDIASAGNRAEVVALAVPYGAVTDIASQRADTVAGKIIDATTLLTSDFSGLATVERSGAVTRTRPRWTAWPAQSSAVPGGDGIPQHLVERANGWPWRTGWTLIGPMDTGT